jgi:hypothetical protein
LSFEAMDTDGRSLQAKESQDTLISMLRLDPTPIDALPEEVEIERRPMDELTPEELEKLEERREEREDVQPVISRGTAASVGLSGSGRGHGPVFYRT